MILKKLRDLLAGKRDFQRTIFGVTVKIWKKRKYNHRYQNLPLQDNKIIFRTFNGSYSCNPKYIAEEIIRQKLPYELVWVVTGKILFFVKDFPLDKIRLVSNFSDEDYRESSTAKVLIDNERRFGYISRGFTKKKGQKYIATWHGSIGIKKTGLERLDFDKKMTRLTEMDSRQVDYLISNSSYTSNFMKTLYLNNGQVLEYGNPRNDIFFRDTSGIKEKILKKYNIPSNKKIFMYAPTFRENYDLAPYSIDFSRVKESLIKRFGGDWTVLFRLHPNMINYKNKLVAKDSSVIDVSDHSDMQELLVSSDVVITDYSSCIYDFVLSRRPGFIFATDLEKYNNSRGLCYPITSTPFPVATSNDELVEKIEKFDVSKYLEDVETFLKGKGSIDDGHASERVVELIKQIVSSAEVSQ